MFSSVPSLLLLMRNKQLKCVSYLNFKFFFFFVPFLITARRLFFFVDTRNHSEKEELCDEYAIFLYMRLFFVCLLWSHKKSLMSTFLHSFLYLICKKKCSTCILSSLTCIKNHVWVGLFYFDGWNEMHNFWLLIHFFLMPIWQLFLRVARLFGF